MADQKTEKEITEEVKEAPQKKADEQETVAQNSQKNEKDEQQEVEVPKKFKSIVDSIEQMSVLDLHELVKLLEKKFNVTAGAVAVATAPGSGAEAVEEKTSFNVELTDVGGQKIAVIKAVKEILGLGLKEAKDLVDGAPAMLKEGVKKEDALEIQKKIEEAGGKAELK
jgi:large subunit ribosomal protein L7/L12